MNKITGVSRSEKRPDFEIDLNEKVIYFECASSSVFGSVLLIALKKKILILAVDFETFSYRKCGEIQEQARIIKLSSEMLGRNFIFAASNGNCLSVFNVLEDESSKCLARLENHGYINSIDFCEDYLASGGDDHLCKIYSAKDNFELQVRLNFSAAVTCVKFNPEELNKLLISVKNGSLFIYCLKLRQSLYSFYSPAPLMNVDWSLHMVAAVANEQVFYFDISKPDIPMFSKRLNDVGKIISINPHNFLVSAVICNRAGTDLKVIHQKSNVSSIFSTKLVSFGGNVVWNSSYLIAGSDRKICFFKIPIN